MPKRPKPRSKKIEKSRERPAKKKESTKSAESFAIVGVGGSAGGLESMLTLFKKLPPDTGMAFVIVQHLSPQQSSSLAQLIGRTTKMPVRDIRHGVGVQPNHVYVLPPNYSVTLNKRALRLSKYTEPHGPHLTVDRFFDSLAQDAGTAAIGVVLSGTGADGTLGLATIKLEGGITIAESEASAKFFGMPGSAISAGSVDKILPAKAIAEELAKIAKHPDWPRHASGKAAAQEEREPFPEGADELGKIYFLLKQRSRVDFANYKHSTLRRRIARRMILQQVESIERYVEILRANPREVDELFNEILIHVTGFFRDAATFTAIKRSVLPKIIRNKKDDGEIRCWVPGCSTGEEVYSLAICMVEALGKELANVKVQIFGTDLSEPMVTKARSGFFSDAAVKGVSEERLRRFFTQMDGSWQVNRNIRDMCTFARQNVCEDPPFSRLDLISCRNVLIYLGPALQKKCFPIFHYALNPGGFLVLGNSETVGGFNDLFTMVDRKQKIYAKKIVPNPPAVEFTSKALSPVDVEAGQRFRVRQHERDLGVEVTRTADRLLLNNYAPAGVVIDADMQVLHFRGRTGKYIEHAPGAASLNLLDMVHGGLAMDVRGAVHKAVKHGINVRKEGIELGHGRDAVVINIEVVPFRIPAASQQWFLVIFEEAPARDVSKKGRRRTQDPGTMENERLQTELRSTKESLQAIIEEQEATNEELKSANEEIESSNEELQSTNEELETAKEELQSTNEELTTLNEELNTRHYETTQANNDLNNLLSSINIPIVMVDNSLVIRRMTPQAEKAFNLIPTDVGRRLSDIKPNIDVPDLAELIRKVVDTLTTCDKEVRDNAGRWWSLRIRPYRTGESKIDGAVITLVDIDGVKKRGVKG